ncbi:hypothetical protein ACHAWF_010549 [Thalassiosira exigua]
MRTTFSGAREISLLSNQSAAPSAARSRHVANFWAAPSAAASSSSGDRISSIGPLKLTLSAYCRPENAVRLTDADPDQVIHAEYELLDPARCRTLGHGASSTVRLAYRRRDGQPVAVKTIAKHDALGLWSRTNRWRDGVRGSLSSPRDAAGEMREQVKKGPRLDEVDVLTSLRGICPNVVQLLDVYETNQEVQLVLEYCDGGDLFDCIKRRKQMEREPDASSSEPLIHGSFTELETASVAKTMLEVLETLHSKNIVHRDIKPENILLVDEDDCMDQLGTVKLTDFGLARILHDDTSSNASCVSDLDGSLKQRSRAYSRVGSDYYAAPEVHLGSGYDTPVDIYSLGVTLYVMLCGAPPSSTSFFKTEEADFSDEESSCVASVSEESTQSSHCSRSELFPSELKISPLAQDLIVKMIHPDPEKRIVASDALKHEWITKHSVQKDTQNVTRAASKLSLSSCNSNARPRALSFAETESFLRIGPALPVVPPSNSPFHNKASEVASLGQMPDACHTPPRPAPDLGAAIGLTLMDVCNKLAPLVDEQQLHKHRKRWHRPHGERKKRSRGGGGDDSPKKKRASSSKKRVYHLAPGACGNDRIGRRFNSPVPIVGPLLPQQSRSPA